MKIRSLRALTCAAVASIATTSASAQVVLPNHAILSYNPDSLDQFALYQTIHNARALLSAPARYTGNPPKVYLVDLSNASLIHEFDYFADDLEMNDDCIAIAFLENGTASVAIHDPTTFDLIRTIEIGDSSPMNSGLSIALHGTTLVVGAENLSANDQDRSGIVRVYNAITGQMLFDPTPADLEERAGFGYKVEIDTDRIYAVKAGSFTKMTAPSIFVFNASTGTLEREIEIDYTTDQPPYVDGFAAENGIIGLGIRSFGDNGFQNTVSLINASNAETNIIDAPDVNYELLGFGSEIGLYNDTFVITGFGYAPGDFFGRARTYVYDRSSLDHVSTLKGTIDDTMRESFSLPDSLDGSILHIGAVELGIEGPVGDGRLLSFDLDRCPTDIDGTQTIDFRDISALLSNRFDWNDDLVFDFFDIQGYLTDYPQGCTE